MAKLLAKHDANYSKNNETEAATMIRSQTCAFVSVIDRQSSSERIEKLTLLNTSETSIIELANRGLTLDQDAASEWWDEDRSDANRLQKLYTAHYEWAGPEPMGF